MKNHKQLLSRFEISHDVPLDGGVLRVHEPQEAQKFLPTTKSNWEHL